MAFKYVHSGNYDSTDANDRRGVNISWSQYDTPSANRHVFTFDTPMGDTNYSIVTDRNYEKDNTITIESKSTTGFTGVWVGADPSVFYEYLNLQINTYKNYCSYRCWKFFYGNSSSGIYMLI